MSDRYEKTEDFRDAHAMSTIGCIAAGCQCDQVFVRFHDKDERLFATMGLTVEQARRTAADLLSDAAKVEAAVARRMGHPVAGHA